jgi:hypothetical protein
VIDYIMNWEVSNKICYKFSRPNLIN